MENVIGNKWWNQLQFVYIPFGDPFFNLVIFAPLLWLFKIGLDFLLYFKHPPAKTKTNKQNWSEAVRKFCGSVHNKTPVDGASSSWNIIKRLSGRHIVSVIR